MLELRGVSFEVDTRDEKKEILSDIDLVIKDTGFLVITGPNGGGKSTLAKIIMGIERPTAGRILFGGKDITDWSVTERARAGIGFAFQQPVRFKGLTVKDLIELAVGRGLSVIDACAYLSEVGLCANEYIHRELDASLSGGELKRIEIAMVMARKMPLSVFDEPEAGIDLWSFQNLIRVFEKLRDQVQGSIVIISHQERILEIADEIVVISGGRISGQGSRAEMLQGLLGDTSPCAYYEKGACV